MLCSLARISWEAGVPLGGKDCFLPFITNCQISVGMIFITCNRKLHLFDNFWTFKTQNTEYKYLYVENYVHKNLKEAVEVYIKQIKNHIVLAKIYKAYIMCTPKWDGFGNNFFPLLSIKNVTSKAEDECSIFFNLHCTVRASSSHPLVIW